MKANPQGFAAGVQGHFQTLRFKQYQQLVQPLRVDPARQAAGYHHCIMAGRDLFQTPQQGGARRFVDLRPLTIDIGHTSIGLDQFDVAARLARDPHEAVGKAAPVDQRFERLQVVPS
ncbi:hypothetical protein D3C80_1719980 [compost metagenome]